MHSSEFEKAPPTPSFPNAGAPLPALPTYWTQFNDLLAHWPEIPRELRMEVLETHLQRGTAIDQMAAHLTPEMSSEERGALGSFLGRCVAAPTYYRTFHGCYRDIDRSDQLAFNHKFTVIQPLCAIMVAPYVRLGEITLTTPPKHPRMSLSRSKTISDKDTDDESLPARIFPDLFDSFEDIDALLCAVFAHGDKKLMQDYAQRVVNLSPDLLIPHIATLLSKGAIAEGDIERILLIDDLFARSKGREFFQTLDERLEYRSILRDAKLKQPLRDPIPHHQFHPLSCPGCRELKLDAAIETRRTAYILQNFSVNCAPYFESSQDMVHYLSERWHSGMPVASHIPALGLGRPALRALIFNAIDDSRLMPEHIFELPSIIAQGEPNGALRLLIGSIRDLHSTTAATISANLPTILDWFNASGQQAILRSLLTYEPTLCIPHLSALNERKLITYASVIRACCDSSRHYNIAQNISELMAHFALASIDDTEIIAARTNLQETLLRELHHRPELLTNDELTALVLTPPERRTAIITELQRDPTAEFLTHVVEMYSNTHFRSDENPVARAIVHSIPIEEVQVVLGSNLDRFLQVVGQYCWEPVGKVLSNSIRDALLIEALSATTIGEVLSGDQIKEYLRENTDFLATVLTKIEAMGMDILLPSLADDVSNRRTSPSGQLARAALVTACTRNPTLACDRHAISVLREDSKSFIKKCASEYIERFPNELVRLHEQLTPHHLAQIELSMRKRLSLSLSDYQLERWLETIRSKLGDAVYDEYVRLNPLLAGSAITEENGGDWYDAVIDAVSELPLATDFLKRLHAIAKTERATYGDRPIIPFSQRNQQFVELIDLVTSASQCSLARTHPEQLAALDLADRWQLYPIMALAFRHGLKHGQVRGIEGDQPPSNPRSFEADRRNLIEAVREYIAAMAEMQPNEISRTISLDGEFVSACDLYMNTTCSEYPAQAPAMRELLRWIALDTFRECRAWGKRDVFTEEERSSCLSEMIHRGLLPSKLSLAHYTEWLADHQCEVETSTGMNVDIISRGTRRILTQAVAERHIPLDILHGNIDRLTERLEVLLQPIAALQLEISTIDAALEGELPSGESRETLRRRRAELKDNARMVRAENGSILDHLESELAIATLLSPRVQNLRDGRIAVGRWRREIGQIFNCMERVFCEEYPAFRGDIIQIRQLVEGVREQHKGHLRVARSELHVHDRVDSKRHFFIGLRPVISCQHFGNDKHYNRGLLAYVLDPNVRIIQIDDESGNFVARAVLRLLEDEHGDPQLFLERTYSTNQHEAVFAAVYDFAHKKAERMKCGLFSHSLECDFEIADSAPTLLISRGSRTGYVYSDAAGGIQNRGKYRITGAFKLVRGAKTVAYERPPT